MSSIAILSMACRFPDARTPEVLWDNVLAGRRSFRAIPVERLELARYAATIIGAADSITEVKAGLLTDWRFDCARFRIPQRTFEAADLTHWLALEVAATAIERAGGVEQLDRARTAVIVANTLAGEFSRAAMLRLRAPFLDELLAEAARAAGLDTEQSIALRRRFAVALRDRFPTPHEETLAGGLANTIAGRVANYFDLHGGAYCVDAACASSLVALADAANLLTNGEIDAAIVGAVDLSLDPFELVGFSRNGALASEDMRVFDARSSGFWPGEGAGFAVLLRMDEARRRELPICAVLRGWGISTDGAGGFTRPAVDGQLLALQRAYQRADVDPADLGYVEAHGTGTAVGDPVEVRALAALRNGAGPSLPIGSIKSNIGHTKAAAGFAGLIKTVAALSDAIVPPHVGCDIPHPIFRELDDKVRPSLCAEHWREGGSRLAGVSGFGFGGINAHLVLQATDPARRAIVVPRAHRPQDAELFVFAAASVEEISTRLEALSLRAPAMSIAELADAASHCSRTIMQGQIRAAIVAENPEALASRLRKAADAIAGNRELLDDDHVFVARRADGPRVGFLFPGQAAPVRPEGGLWARRFDGVPPLLAAIPGLSAGDPVNTAIAQPTIAAGSLAALRILRDCGIDACVAAGHSLGELTALMWAGAIAEDDIIALAAARGTIMAAHGRSGGGMLRIAARAEHVQGLLDGLALTIACDNGPAETVVSGPNPDLLRIEQMARQSGLETTRLSVSHAFHSPMMDPAIAPFTMALLGFSVQPVRRRVVSTVTGQPLDPAAPLREILVRQLVAPVQFDAALRQISTETDILIELGPGSGLTRLARQAGSRVLSVDAFADSLRPLLSVVGAAFVHGCGISFDCLFRDRRLRLIDIAERPQFLSSPCGRHAAVANSFEAPLELADSLSEIPSQVVGTHAPAPTDMLATVRAIIAEETGFQSADIREDDRLLDDLHLSSIAVARIVTKAAQRISVQPPARSTEYANATARELATGLAALHNLRSAPTVDSEFPPGVAPWVRTFAVRWTERPGLSSSGQSIRWNVAIINGSDHDRRLAGSLGCGAEAADGLLVWLGADLDVTSTGELFAACRAAWQRPGIVHLGICHAGAPISAFARSLATEDRFKSVTVIERPRENSTADRIRSELEHGKSGFQEVRIDCEGRRFEPELAACAPVCVPGAALDSRDVVLVTGGAKGIGAECAIRIATRAGAALALVGRSRADDAAVIATLKRARAAGLRCHYASADVADAQGLADAVSALTRELGPITALIHAAGVSDPMLFPNIGEENLDRVLAPKTVGLRAAVAAAGPQLRRIVTFGSILGRLGLKGEAHYAIANAWQSEIAEQISRTRLDCDVLSLEWSIWNAAGMGHRLGSIERLARLGVEAISLDQGLDMFERLVLGGAIGTVIVTSRFGPPRDVSLGSVELPILRFLEKPLLHYPGVELVVEVELSRGRDLYLDDHRVDGMQVMPAVLVLEAMAQVTGSLIGFASAPVIEAVSFHRAIVVPETGVSRIRIMTLADENGRVEAAIRAEDDGFAMETARARFILGSPPPATVRQAIPSCGPALPARALYGPLLFQGKRFQRIQRYTCASARRIAALISSVPDVPWFSPFEPQRLVLGDPGARDALLHALQAAVPHLRVVPVAVGRIVSRHGGPPVRVEAFEQHATVDTFVFDIIARDAEGVVVEEWQGATFRGISATNIDEILRIGPQLAAVYIERKLRLAVEDPSIEVAFICDSTLGREQRRARALAALGIDAKVFARNDGKPIILGGGSKTNLSIAHRDGVTLAVAADHEISCDVELVADWTEANSNAPLSAEGYALAAKLAASSGEPWAAAAARIWSVGEVALKHSLPADMPCQMHVGRDGVVIFETSSGRTASIRLPGIADKVVVAVGTSTAFNGGPRSDELPKAAVSTKVAL